MAEDDKKSLSSKVTKGQKSAGDSKKTVKSSVGEESASKSEEGKPSSSLFSGLKGSVKSLWGKSKDAKEDSVKKPEVADKKTSKKAEQKEGKKPLTVSKKTDSVKEPTVKEVTEESDTVSKKPKETKVVATSKEPAEKKDTVSKEKKQEPKVASKQPPAEKQKSVAAAEKQKPVAASEKAEQKEAETATASKESEVKQEEPVAEKPVALKEVKAKPKEPPRPQIKLSGLFAFKMEMTSFYEEGKVVPVTALHYEPWRVSQIKTKEKEGYDAIQLACHSQKNKRSTKPLIEHLKPAGFKEGARYIRELRLEKALEDIQVGHELSIESLKKGDIVKVSSRSKGRGFAGVMKRWGFRGGKASHGSKSHRRPGSIGQHTEPSRVFPGRKMPGHYGHQKVCLKNVQVVDVLPEENLIFVKGAVPGSRNTLVTLRKQELKNA